MYNRGGEWKVHVELSNSWTRIYHELSKKAYLEDLRMIGAILLMSATPLFSIALLVVVENG